MWTGDPRTTSPQWRALRVMVLERDHGICHVCKKPGATEVDHVVAVADGGTDDPANLAPIHPHPCHARKSSAEGNRARWQRHTTKRPTERHPGLKGGG